MWNQVRKKILYLLRAAACIGICGCLFFAAELHAEPVSGQKEIEPGDTSWMDEEVVMELDENNMDENGFIYTLSSYNKQQEAKLKEIQIRRYQDRETTIRLRIPDKVVKEGEEYVVTNVLIDEDELNVRMRADFCFYVGREVRNIQWLGIPCAGTCYPHRESEYFAEEGGVLFNHDKTELIHFNNEYYGPNKVYEIPETVCKIKNYAFEYAQIKEVVLNDKITLLPRSVFHDSTLQKIDLKNVKIIEDYAFYYCKMLKEVRIRQEGVLIEQRAFAGSGIESLYLPPGAFVDCFADFERCESLKTVIIGGKFRMGEHNYATGLLDGCRSLQTVVLPEDLTEIREDMFRRCMSLRKLYVPDRVTVIGERAFDVRGNLTLYAHKGSPVAAYDDDNVSFADLDGHEHTLKEVMFMKYDTWGVKGKYCEECAYGTEIEVVEFDEGAAQDIPVLENDGNTCPEVLELDENNTDAQGVIYRLDAVNKTASVDDLDETRPFPKDIIIVPGSVEKDGIRYPVEALEQSALNQTAIVVLPDSVKELKRYSVWNAQKLVLGKGVQYIDSDAFVSSLKYIEIRGDNPYYRMIDGVLYTSDKKVLLKRTPGGANYFEKEYKIPSTVTEVMPYAFGHNYQLDRIVVYSCGKKEMKNLTFDSYYAEVCYADDYTWYDIEDTIVDLDVKNQDENGLVYKLYGADKMAELISIDASEYDESTGEMTVKIPDWVRKDGRIYKVTTVTLNQENTLPDDIRIRLFIGKYVTQINSLLRFPCKITSYISLENNAFTSEKGSLFDRERKRLYRFCDEAFDCNSVYVLPAETASIVYYAFSGTAIRKIDINQVREIGPQGFLDCDSLEEVIMRNEGVYIGGSAFSRAKKLEYVYIPDKSRLSRSCFKESGLKTIIIGEGMGYYNSDSEQFASCKDLKTCILPEDLTALPKSLFWSCSSLKKLYIPQEVGEVGQYCFSNMTGSVYAAEGGVVEESVKSSRTAQFVSLQGHTHHMERVTFFAFDTWAVTGDYCSECAYGTRCERVELQDENDRAELPPLLGTEPELPVPTPTPIATETPTPTPTAAPVATEIPTPLSTETPIATETPMSLPTETPLPTEIPVATEIPTPLPTETPVATEIPTPLPTETPVATEIPTPTPVPTETPAPLPTATPVATEMPTETPVATEIPTPIPIEPPLPTETSIPTETATPFPVVTPVPTETPVATETPMPTVAPVVTEIPTPFPTETPVATEIPTSLPTETPIATETPMPLPTETSMPTSTPVATEIPTPLPTETPVVTETPFPTVTSTLTATSMPTAAPMTEPPALIPVMSNADQNGYKQKLLVTNFQVFSKDNKSACLQWKKNKSASSYRIYRSKKKNGKYRVVKTVVSSKNYYVDKKIKPTRKYYYKIKALGYFGGKMVEGKESSICSISVSGICNPKISVRKGRLRQIRYVTVCLKKYQGKYADIYISIDRKKFKKLNLVSNKISKYKGKFKIQYVIKNKKIRFKVKTYRKKGKGYSDFSNVVEVRV